MGLRGFSAHLGMRCRKRSALFDASPATLNVRHAGGTAFNGSFARKRRHGVTKQIPQARTLLGESGTRRDRRGFKRMRLRRRCAACHEGG